MRDEWRDALAREGLTPVVAPGGDGDEPPCPACGSAAGLDAGACKDCGLQLG